MTKIVEDRRRIRNARQVRTRQARRPRHARRRQHARDAGAWQGRGRRGVRARPGPRRWSSPSIRPLATDLKKPVDDYRDKDLFEFRNFNAGTAARSRAAPTPTSSRRSPAPARTPRTNGSASSTATSATDVDAAKMDDFLSKLIALRAQSFVPAGNTHRPGQADAGRLGQLRRRQVRARAHRRETADAFAARDGEPGAAKLDATAYDDDDQGARRAVASRHRRRGSARTAA